MFAQYTFPTFTLKGENTYNTVVILINNISQLRDILVHIIHADAINLKEPNMN